MAPAHPVRLHRWIWIVLGVVAAAVALSLAGNQAREAAALASELTQPHRSTPGARPQDLAPRFEDVAFPSRVDHLTLRGWLLHSATFGGRSIVVTHGSNADRALNADLARRLVQAGYDVLLFDFRACGQSEGDHQTFGNLERRDVLGAHDFMVAHGYAAAMMTFLGNSAGATALLRAAPEMPDVAAIVSDSAFASAAPLFDAFWSDAGESRPLVWLATELTRLDGADPHALTGDAVRSMPARAVLFIHARGDRRIPFTDAQALRAASVDPQSELWISDARGHDASFSNDPAEYLRRVLGFIDGQIAARR